MLIRGDKHCLEKLKLESQRYLQAFLVCTDIHQNTSERGVFIGTMKNKAGMSVNLYAMRPDITKNRMISYKFSYNDEMVEISSSMDLPILAEETIAHMVGDVEEATMDDIDMMVEYVQDFHVYVREQHTYIYNRIKLYYDEFTATRDEFYLGVLHAH